MNISKLENPQQGWHAWFIATLLFAICVSTLPFVVTGCANTSEITKTALKDVGKVATLVALDVAIDSVKELQPYQAALETGIGAAFDRHDDPKAIAASIGASLASTALSGQLQNYLRSSLREGLLGEGPGSTGSPGPEQAAFNAAIANAL